MPKIETVQQAAHPSIEFSVELMSRKELLEYLNDIRRTLNSLDLKFIMMNLERRLRVCEHILGIEPPPPMGHGGLVAEEFNPKDVRQSSEDK